MDKDTDAHRHLTRRTVLVGPRLLSRALGTLAAVDAGAAPERGGSKL